MQGSYNSNGLPRPYYMKPNKKKLPYSNLKEPIVFFNSPKRKLMGYMVMFMLIGTLMWWVSQDMKVKPEPEYELAGHDSGSSSSSSNNINNNNNNNVNGANNNNKIDIDTKNNANLDNIVNAVGSKADKESENIDLAGNLAQGSKGEKGIGVVEAPKGGMANEAPVVGTDEDKLVGTGGKKAKNNNANNANNANAAAGNKKGYKASIGNVEDNIVAAKKPVAAAPAAAAPAAAAAAAKQALDDDSEPDIAQANKIAKNNKAQQVLDEEEAQ